MKNYISNLSPGKAAIIVGISFITSVFIVTLIDDFLLANFVVPGDSAALAMDIEANRKLFGIAVTCYLFVLVLDSVIGLALYVVLKPANKKLAWYTGALRLLYAFTLIIGLFALVFQIIDVYNYASLKLFGYIFFALHILVLGYSVFKSGYMPKSLGILLMFTSFTYIVFYIDNTNLSEILMVSTMLIMLIGELSLSIWLMWKRNRLPQKV
ncbi:MAG TPA: DUF4386 domain-containing protein [Draconibacterium sp.]|nr:DUF4386 domain-containing protein [Draconibacterium sp.]